MTEPSTGEASAQLVRREAAGWLLATALLVALLLGYLMPATAWFTAVPGDLADARYNSFVLEHLYRVATGRAELWNPAFFYPFQGVLAFSDNHLGSGATYVLARLLGLSREHALDAWFVIGTLLNFASALYVLRRLGFSVAAAALGAFFFAFGLPVSPQDNHLQLVHRFAAPLAVLALLQMFERRRLADLARVVFFTVWQFFCSIYLGLFLVYLLAALAVGLLLAVRRPFDWPLWRSNLSAEPLSSRLSAAGLLLAALAAFAYLAGNYLAASRSYKLWRPIETISELLPRPSSYLMADASPLLSWMGRDISLVGRWEHQLFIGFGAIALVLAAAVAAWRGRAAVGGLTWPMLIALALLASGTLWVDGYSLYYLVASLPAIEGIRAVSRIILIMLVPLSVLVALAVDAVWARFRWSPIALAGLVILVVAEPLSVRMVNTPIEQWHRRLDPLKAALPPALAQDAILMVRIPSTDIDEQVLVEIDGMLLGQELDRPVLNGHSGFYPIGYRTHHCVSARERLWGYLLFKGGGIDLSPYFRRLFVLDLGSCPPADR